jgi:hypothetical protein
MSLLKILKENINKQKPMICKGDFFCQYNKLKSLKGCPTEVGGNFDCSHNQLTSLEGSPEIIGKDFWCNSNDKLTSLEGCPTKVGRDFYCNGNRILPKEEIMKLKALGIVKGYIFSDYGEF